MIGRRLAHYDITAHLGSGAMGEVYQATDSKLGRTVALKFLPEAFAHDADRSARFNREARTLAAINHPHIAAIYGVEEAEGRSFLVMELVPGQTLAERIGRQPVHPDEALVIARQIARALEAAHDKGIVHRDLKPANIKITPEGQVKVLDFGLAKLAEDKSGDSGGTLAAGAPAAETAATHTGIVLGTPAYMSPEQAQGLPADRRADIFSFGCVLYEMLTGRMPFAGQNVADVMARVLQQDPDWTRLPSNVPPSMDRLVRLCLEKDPRKRRQSAGDVRIDLDQAASERLAPAATGRARGSALKRALWGGAILAVMTALAIPAVNHLRETPPPEVRLQVVTPASRFPQQYALSPDGQSLVFVASASADAPDRLYLRRLNDEAQLPIAGTEGAQQPFWSPDGRSLGYFAYGKLYRVDVAGGRPQALASTPAALGGSWSDGTVLFAPNTASPLLRVPASGGDAVPVTKLDPPRQIGHSRPAFLPDGRQFLFNITGDPETAGIHLGSLDGGAARRLIGASSYGGYLPGGHLVFVEAGSLVARKFDAASGTLSGDPVTLAKSVGTFATSLAGIVAYRGNVGTQTQETWVDRQGRVLGNVGDVRVNGPELAPDERLLAGDRTVDGNRDVWFVDLMRGGQTRFTNDPAIDGYPVWSPDGSQVVFTSNRKGTFDLWIKAASGAGSEQLLLETPESDWPMHWSRDGGFVLFQKSDLQTRWDLWAMPMTGSSRTPIPVAATAFTERMGEFSPDGRWVVYDTDESGRPEVVAQAFPEAKGKIPISTAGGLAPRWSADGKDIHFIGLDGRMLTVPIAIKNGAFEAGTPVASFATQLGGQPFKFQYAVARDGRFLINQLLPVPSPPPISIILNLRLK